MAKKAFLIGANTLGLRYCMEDVNRIGEALALYDYQITATQAGQTKRDIMEQFDTLVSQCDKTDTLICYFSGHGLLRQGMLDLIIANEINSRNSKIPISEITDALSECKAAHKLLILDCCHANATIETWQLDPTEDYRLLTASDRLEKTKELEHCQASFFTYYLHQVLTNPPDTILDKKGNLRLNELYAWLVEATQQYNSQPQVKPIPYPNLLGNHKANFEIATISPNQVSPSNWSEQRIELDYRRLLLKICDIVDLANLPEDRHLATQQMELRRLYVALRVRLEVPATQEATDTDLETIEKGRQQWRGSWGETVRVDKVKEKFSIGQRLRLARRVMVLGDPGAGKTTMLRWLTTAYLFRAQQDGTWQQLPDSDTLPDENWLPIWIRCRNFSPQSMPKTLVEMLKYTLQTYEGLYDKTEALLKLLLSKLQTGQAILLIDGLDEITDLSARIRLCEQIEQIAQMYEAAPIVVTSRIVGYREMGYRLGRGFEHVTVAELSKNDKDEFAQRWCALTESPDRCTTATTELKQDLHSHDRIERLTGNPMLLTTMALVKRKVGKLPSRRADLYGEAVQVLLNWRSAVDKPLDPHEAKPQLEYVAFAMCQRGIQQIRQGELLELLTTMRQEYPNLYALKQHPPHEFLRLLERRTGLLVEAGETRHAGELEPVFEFRHLTFQEYLAGLALVQKQFPKWNKERTLASYVAELAGEIDTKGDELTVADHWREALRLCVTTCPNDEVDAVLQAIATPLPHEDPTKTAYPRAVLAAMCLTDEPNVSQETALSIIERSAIFLTNEKIVRNESKSLTSAFNQLAASHWQKVLRNCFVELLFSSKSDLRLFYGVFLGISNQKNIPKDEVGISKWFNQQISLLDSQKENIIVEAIFNIGAFTENNPESNHIVIKQEFIDKLISQLPQSDNFSAASAILLGTLVEQKIWTPLVAETDLLIRFINDLNSNNLVAAYIASILTLPKSPQLVNSLCERFKNSTWFVKIGLVTALGTSGDTQAVDPLLTMLYDPDNDIRETVVAALGKLGDKQAVTPLLTMLQDPDNDMRKSVIEALGKLGDKQVVDPLLTMLHDSDNNVRKAVVEALSKLGDKQVVDPLLTMLHDSDNNVRKAVVEALGKLGDKQIIDPLLTMLQDADKWVRYATVNRLCERRDVDSIDPLLTMLHDPDELVRNTTIRALNTLRHPKTIDSLLMMLTQPNKTAREAAIKALGMYNLRDKRAVAPLLTLLSDPDKEIQRVTVETLGNLKDEQAVPPLLTMLATPDKNVRRAVVIALGKLKVTQAIDSLLAMVSDSDNNVRGAVATALGQLGDTRTVTALLAMLPDPDSSVRNAAITALGKLGDPQSVDPLLTMLSDSHKDAWVATITALGQLGDTRAVTPLLTMLSYVNKNIRRAVVEALGKLGDTQAIAPLLPLLTHPDNDIRRAVVVALGQLGDKRAIDPLIAMLPDPDWRVQNSITTALAQLGDSQTVDTLLTMLSDPDSKVKPIIVTILGKLGDKRAIDPLIAILSDPDSNIQEAAITAVGQLGDAKAVDPLLAILPNYNNNVSMAIASALGKLGDKKVIDILLTMLSDSDNDMRRAIITSLGQLGDIRAVAPLLTMLPNPDKRVRITAATALGKLGDTAPLLAMLADPDSDTRKNILQALAQLWDYDEIDMRLLSRDLDNAYPFLDPQDEIGMVQVREAAIKLKLDETEVRTRYERMAVQLKLRLAWLQEEAVA